MNSFRGERTPRPPPTVVAQSPKREPNPKHASAANSSYPDGMATGLRSCQAMTDHDVRSLVDRFNAAWNDHDLNAAVLMCTEDAAFESTGPFPDGTRHVGRSALREAWEPIFANPASHFVIEEVVVLGNDRAVQRFRYDWGDGHIRGIDLFRCRDGLVAEKLSYVKG